MFVEVFGHIVSESLAHTVALYFLQKMPYGRGQSTGLISVACCVLQISSLQLSGKHDRQARGRPSTSRRRTCLVCWISFRVQKKRNVWNKIRGQDK